MNLASLILAFRRVAKDTSPVAIWPDSEIVIYLADAEIEAATRANLIKETVDVQTSINEPNYDMPEGTLEIFRVKPRGPENPLTRKTIDQLDKENSNWEALSGTPTNYLYENLVLRLVSTPVAISMYDVTYSRLPKALTADGPEIPSRLQLKLLDWALYLAYSNRNSGEADRITAAQHSNRFTKSFGESADANVQTQRIVHIPTNDRPGWF